MQIPSTPDPTMPLAICIQISLDPFSLQIASAKAHWPAPKTSLVNEKMLIDDMDQRCMTSIDRVHEVKAASVRLHICS